MRGNPSQAASWLTSIATFTSSVAPPCQAGPDTIAQPDLPKRGLQSSITIGGTTSVPPVSLLREDTMFDWMEKAGKISDREIARRYGVSASTVRRFRLLNKIPACAVAELPQEAISNLGSMTNYKLNKLYHAPLARIAEERTRLGIPEPKIKRDKFIRLVPDFWTAETISQLGTMPDPELADKLGISKYPIRKKRQELGIASFRKSYPAITDEIAAKFGTLSDRRIAELLGVSPSHIQRARKKRNCTQ